MNRLLAFFAFLMLLGFIGILVVELPRWDVGLVAALVIGLAAFDLLTSARDKPGR